MFRAPFGIVVPFLALIPVCAVCATGDPIPIKSRKLVFAPVGFNCPGKNESTIIEEIDGLLEDLSLVFSGVRGVSLPVTDLRGRTQQLLRPSNSTHGTSYD